VYPELFLPGSKAVLKLLKLFGIMTTSPPKQLLDVSVGNTASRSHDVFRFLDLPAGMYLSLGP
jgi:hypothetical protein